MINKNFNVIDCTGRLLFVFLQSASCRNKSGRVCHPEQGRQTNMSDVSPSDPERAGSHSNT